MNSNLKCNSPFDQIRSGLMPATAPVEPSLETVREYVAWTGNAAEIHYAFIAGVNDRDEDADELIRLLKPALLPIKFLAFNEKPGLDMRRSDRLEPMRAHLEAAGIPTEYYVPDGANIGSSCGQFLTSYYKIHNAKQK